MMNSTRGSQTTARTPDPERKKDEEPRSTPLPEPAQILDELCLKGKEGQRRGHLLMLVGTPGSGKSTLAEYFRASGWTIISSDRIREELTGSEKHDPLTNPVVWETIEYRLRHRLRQGEEVVLDSTNVRAVQREKNLNIAHECSAIASAVVLLAPPSLALARNSNRARQVPEAVIREMWSDLLNDWPSASEGFDLVLTVDPHEYGIMSISPATVADATAKEN